MQSWVDGVITSIWHRCARIVWIREVVTDEQVAIYSPLVRRSSALDTRLLGSANTLVDRISTKARIIINEVVFQVNILRALLRVEKIIFRMHESMWAIGLDKFCIRLRQDLLIISFLEESWPKRLAINGYWIFGLFYSSRSWLPLRAVITEVCLRLNEELLVFLFVQGVIITGFGR